MIFSIYAKELKYVCSNLHMNVYSISIHNL